jgi:hypothetical protein
VRSLDEYSFTNVIPDKGTPAARPVRRAPDLLEIAGPPENLSLFGTLDWLNQPETAHVGLY